jgi:cytoskeletal protein CcmA (bactofilin family)
MQTYHGTMQGPVVLTEDLDFYGRLNGDASAASGVTLHFHGIMTGDLTIETGASVDLRGRVNGSVLNKGRLTIYGQVGGAVTDEGGQTTAMWPGAVRSGTLLG